MQEIKLKHLCAYCIFEPATCEVESDGLDYGKGCDDSVLGCDRFKLLTVKEMFFIRRCRQTIRQIMEDKVVINFNNCDSKRAKELLVECLKSLYKNWANVDNTEEG